MQVVDLLKNSSYEEKMDSLIAAILTEKNTNYEIMDNKPKINGNELYGNKTNAELGIPVNTSDLINDSYYVSDQNYVHTDNNYTDAEKVDVLTIKDKINKTGDISNTIVTFTASTERTNLTTGEKISSILGKISKWFSDLKSVAFSGSYNDLSDKPNLGTAASKDVASSGDATDSQIVKGDDTRLSNARPASDVSSWAKLDHKPTYTKEEIGLSNVDNTADKDKNVKYATSSGDASTVNGHNVDIDVPSNAKFTDTVYKHPTTSGNKHIPSGGSSGQILKWSANGTAIWGDESSGSNNEIISSTEPINLSTGDYWIKRIN